MIRLILVLSFLGLSACEDGVGPLDVPAPGTGEEPGEPPTDEPTPTATSALCVPADVEAPLSDEEMETAGPFEVAVETVKFVDPTRATAANGSYEGADERTLDTAIYYPAGERGTWQPIWEPTVAHPDGPFPLVVYSHGFTSSKDEAKKVATHLASHGFIVAAPTFPLSNMMAPGGATFSDVPNQPGDVSFVIDQLQAKSLLASDYLYGAVDRDRVGLMGLSLGGLTTSLATFHPWFADSRVKVAVTLAGPSFFFTESFYRFREVPLLIMHGDIDSFIDYEWNAVTALERAQPNANLLTIKDGSHTGFSSIAPEFLMDIIGGFLAPDDAHPDNPDGLGCGFAAETIADDAESSGGAEFAAGLGGLDQGVELTEESLNAPLPCENGHVSKPAISADEQVAYTKRAALAFLGSYLADSEDERARYCHYTYEVLPKDDGLILE